MNWYEAMKWVKNLRVAGYSDWRLPTKDELAAFAKQAGGRPAKYFNSNGFTNVQARNYWSASTYAGGTTGAWFVYMDGGYVYYDGKDNGFYVWPVRGGQ